MRKPPEPPQDFSIQQAMQIARSPAGQQLIALLQKNGGQEFQNAMAKAASGDYEQAKQALSALMADPEAQALLNELGR